MAIVPQGAYSAAVEYKKLDLVNGLGGSYMYINPTPAAGVSLTNTTHWQQIATMGGQDLVDAAVAARDAAQGYKDAAAASAAQLAAGAGSPVGPPYATLAALNAANPSHSYNYLILDNGHWCYYNTGTSAFVDSGYVWQAASVAHITEKIGAETVGAPIVQSIANGSDPWAYAPNTVYTPEYIPCLPGQTVTVEVRKALPVGHYYTFGFGLFDADKVAKLRADPGPTTSSFGQHKVPPGIAFARFTISEYDADGVIVTLRVGDFLPNDVIVWVRNADSLFDNTFATLSDQLRATYYKATRDGTLEKMVYAPNRLANSIIHHYEFDIEASVASGYKFGVVYYTSDGTYVSATSWFTTPHIILAGSYFVTIFAKASDANLELSDAVNIAFRPSVSIMSGLYDELPYADNSSFKSQAEAFAALFNDTDDAESFAFFSDPHLLDGATYDALLGGYMTAVKRCISMAPVSFVASGGDWFASGPTQQEACFKLGYINGIMRETFRNYHLIVGNHDINFLGTDETLEVNSGELMSSTIRNLWHRDRGESYYAFEGQNTTFYVLDCGSDWGSDSMTARRWGQIDWLADNLLAETNPHSAILMHMYYVATVSGGIVASFSSNVGALCAAYNAHTSVTLNSQTYNFSACTGKVEFIMVGHSHEDFNTTQNGIPVIGIVNFTSGSIPSYDLVLVDYDAGQIEMVRIGTGSDRTIALA